MAISRKDKKGFCRLRLPEDRYEFVRLLSWYIRNGDANFLETVGSQHKHLGRDFELLLFADKYDRPNLVLVMKRTLSAIFSATNRTRIPARCLL